MVDKAITELAELTTPSAADLLHIIDDVSGTATNKKIELGNINQFVNVKHHGAIGDGITDDQSAIAAVMAAFAGQTIYFPEGTYLVDVIIPPSNTTIWMDPGVTILRSATGTNVIRFANVNDVHVYCNGATLDASTASLTASNSINFTGAVRCTLRDPYVKGAGRDTKDGVYFGQGTLTSSIDCGVIGGRIEDSLRNGVSFVSSIRCYLDGVEIYGAVGAPGFGVDVEANNHDEFCIYNIIRNCDIHDNQVDGIGCVFGDQTLIENNKVHDNGKKGIRVSSGGNTRDPVYRRNNVDVMGISAFDQTNGWITVGGSLDLLPIGMGVSPGTQNGSTLPGGLSSQGYVVTEHNGTTQIRVGAAVDESSIESFSGAEVGTGNIDPDLSDFILNVLGGDGQSSKYRIVGNTCYGNGEEGISGASCDHLTVEGNRCYNNTERQFFFQGCYKLTFVNNQGYTDTPVNYSGATLTRCHNAYVSGNKFNNIGYVGLEIISSSGSKSIGNEADNCGENGSGVTSANMRVDTCANVLISGNSGRNAESYPATSYGLVTSNTTNCNFTDNIFIKAGPDNTNSIVISGTGHFYSNNRKYDGTLYV